MARVKTPWLLVTLICAVAFWLRTQAIGYGLPAVYNMDEVAIMNRAIAFGTGTLNPGNFLYPTFYFYALFAWQGLTFLVGLAMGLWDSMPAFERQFFVDPSALYKSGRLLSALCGTATVAVVYLIGARVRGPVTGIVAAMLMAAAPIAVQDAHYVKHDVPVTLLIALVPLALTSSSRHRVTLAGALAGLALSTHYYAVFAVLTVIVERLTAIDEPWDRRWRTLAIAAAAGAAFFIVGSPFLIPEWRTAWTDITQNRAIVMGRATEAAGPFGTLGTYLRWLSWDAFGAPAALVAVVGVFVSWRDRWRTTAWLVVFPVAFLLFLANTVPATRYLNPVLPFTALLASWAVVSAGEALVRRWSPAWYATWILTLVLVVPGIVRSVTLGRFFNAEDTRTQAQRWIETNVPEGATVLMQPYSVPLRQSRDGLAEALRSHLGDETRASVKFQRQLDLRPYPTPAYRTIYLGDGGLDVDKIYVSPSAFDREGTLEPLMRLGVRWVVLKRYNVANPSLASLDRALAREGRLIVSFSPYQASTRSNVPPFEHNEDARLDPALARPGPVIELWRIN